VTTVLDYMVGPIARCHLIWHASVMFHLCILLVKLNFEKSERRTKNCKLN